MTEFADIADRYFMCDKFKCDLKVSRCLEMRSGEKKRKECRGCKQHESLSAENTRECNSIEDVARAQIKAEPERKIKDLRHLGHSLAYNMKNRYNKV